MYDISGKKIQLLFDGDLKASGKKQFSVSNLSKGIYFITITSGANAITNRLVLDK